MSEKREQKIRHFHQMGFWFKSKRLFAYDRRKLQATRLEK